MTKQTSSLGLEGRCSWFVRQKFTYRWTTGEDDAWIDGFLSTDFVQRVFDVSSENRDKFVLNLISMIVVAQ